MTSRRMFNSIVVGASLAGTSAAWSKTATGPGAQTPDTRTVYQVRNVSFSSSGEAIAGKLLTPVTGVRHPAVVIMGPVAFVKEQSPVQYATRLAAHGLAVLIFDPRHHGDSTGAPRRLESGEAKVEDLRAALDFLAKQDEIDADRLHLLGICQGVNWTIEAAVQDDRIAALAVVAGHYLTPDTARMYLGDDATIAARMERSAKASAKAAETGEVDYIPIVGSDDALLTATAVADWYLPWDNRAPWLTYRGGWENRIAAMSEAGIWGWRIDETSARLNLPVLMIHGDKAASGPEIPRRIYESIPSAQKSLHWIDGANQLQFYEDPLTIDAVVNVLAPHFQGVPIDL
ncbi:MAG: alpha/beta hydrolase [Geminicoccales bacterium]